MENQKSILCALMEIHALIEEYAKIDDCLRNPENAIIGIEDELKLTIEEIKALQANEFSPQSISGIEKIVRDRMHLTFFHFLCILDGVGDPKFRIDDDTVWLGLRLEDRRLRNDVPEAGYEEFLHDLLYEAHWQWQEMKSNK